MGWIEDAHMPVAAAAAILGLEGSEKRGYPCPACHEERRDQRGAVGLTRDGMGWRCWLCDVRGDALDMVSYAVLGRRLRDAGPEGLVLVRDRLGAAPAPQAPRRVVPAAPPVRCDPGALAAFWGQCGPVGRLPYAVARGYGDCPDHLARLTPCPPGEAWPGWWPVGWGECWRLVTRGWAVPGEPASLHGRAVVERPMWGGRQAPKTLWARGVDAVGLMFWNQRKPQDVSAVLIAEGMTDWLALAMWAESRPVAVYGATSGGFSGLRGMDIPRHVDVVVAVDEDPAGDGYLREILAAIPGRKIRRARPSRFGHLLNKPDTMAAK